MREVVRSRDGVDVGIGSQDPEALVPPVPGPTESTSKAMVTEMSIGEEDFQQLQAPEGMGITFCLKEFRVSSSVLPLPTPPFCPSQALTDLLPSQGLLSFAESANLPVSIHFDAPGR